MKISYLLPKKIITKQGDFINIESLLSCDIDQPSFQFGDNFMSNGGGFIILDFGQEINGGLRIVNQGSGNQNDQNKIHVIFGESVSEVMFGVGNKNSTNNHSPRDFDYILPDFSKVEFGDTGFRFVRIDFKEGINQRIYSINAISKEIDEIPLGYFKSSDEELNNIFEVAATTAKLCVLDYIVDGIKRDRLVWAGDLFIELKSLNYLFGNLSQVEKTLLFIEKTNPMPGYIQNMPTYNVWYLACINEYFKLNGANEFVKRRREYLSHILKLIFDRVADNGSISFEGVNGVSFPYFIDWRTSENKDVKDANPCFYLFILNECKELLKALNLDEITNKIIDKINKFSPKTFNVSQFDCFSLLAKKGNKNEIINSIMSSKESQFSPFSYIFVLKALFESNQKEALNLFKNYNMAMINLGATSFFEEFDYSWKDGVKLDEMPSDKFNFLTDAGSGCYKGLRKSLCHGWASGPISFIIEDIVGFKGIENNTVILKPFTEGITHFEASFICSLGKIDVNFKNNTFNIKTPIGVKYRII